MLAVSFAFGHNMINWLRYVRSCYVISLTWHEYFGASLALLNESQWHIPFVAAISHLWSAEVIEAKSGDCGWQCPEARHSPLFMVNYKARTSLHVPYAKLDQYVLTRGCKIMRYHETMPNFEPECLKILMFGTHSILILFDHNLLTFPTNVLVPHHLCEREHGTRKWTTRCFWFKALAPTPSRRKMSHAPQGAL